MNVRIGKISKILTPSYSGCGRCDTTWAFVDYHNTFYTENNGMFPLCEKCWSELTPEQRLPYYYNLFIEWDNRDFSEFNLIRKAVMDGK